MINRTWLYVAATLLLYAGPVLAGIAGLPWDVAPVFAAIFLLWLVVLRPQMWPRTLADWLTPSALAAFVARALVQVLLVLACMAIGRSIGGLFDPPPASPRAVALGLSLASVPLCRLIWDPVKAQQMEALLDDALNQIEGRKPSEKTPPDHDA
jgi:hypothetical protein